MLIRLFASFREMESRAERAESVADVLRDRISALEDQLAEERKAYRELAGDTIKGNRAEIDFFAQSRFGRGVYERGQELPVPSGPPQMLQPMRRQATAVVAEQWKALEQDFLDEKAS